MTTRLGDNSGERGTSSSSAIAACSSVVVPGKIGARAVVLKHILPPAVILWLLRRAAAVGRSRTNLILKGLAPVAAVVVLARPIKLFIWLLRRRCNLACDFPGRLPVIGHMYAMSKFPQRQPERIWDYFTRTHLELGQTLRLVVGPEFAPIKVINMTTDPENIEHILKTGFEKYGKGQDNALLFEEFLGRGIFVVDGDAWRHQRKIAASIFSRRNFSQNMIHVFQAHGRRLVDILKRQAREQPSSEIDLHRLFFALTLDAFSEIGLGYPWNSMEEEAGVVPAAADDAGGAVDPAWRREWGRHFDIAQAIIVNRFAYRPFWKLERALYRLGFLPASHQEAQLERSVRFLNRVVSELLARRLAERRASRPAAAGAHAPRAGGSDGGAASTADAGAAQERQSGPADLLSLFMEASEDKEYLRDVVMNFVIAGRDTTACTLAWLFWELAQFPDACARAREEVLRESRHGESATCGDNVGNGAGGSDTLSFETLGRLKFCTACVRETVRLHPPVPVDAKAAFEDDILPDGTLISKGDLVFFTPYQMARDPRLWGPDAAEWRPERWLEMEKEPSPFVNCAFQAGPRICLGRDMAILEAKAVLAQVLLSGLSWKVRSGYTPTYKYPSIVLPMADPGLPVFVSEVDTAASSESC